MFLRIFFAAAVAAGVVLMAPVERTVAQDKKGTCEFGADDQKLKGAARKKFISRCMAKEDAPVKKRKPKKKAEPKAN